MIPQKENMSQDEAEPVEFCRELTRDEMSTFVVGLSHCGTIIWLSLFLAWDKLTLITSNS